MLGPNAYSMPRSVKNKQVNRLTQQQKNVDL